MRAMLCHETGSIDGLVPGEVPDPVPGPGQIAVDVHAAGLNFGDALMVEGSYQEKPALPFAPGMEVAGVVRALGPGVDHFAVGDRVLAMPGHGGYAEIAVAEASAAARIPDAMPFETAAGFAVTYCTAHGALVWRGRLRSGELLMVHAAAGGVGLATVEVGKALGAEVIATAGGPEKLAIAADHGADHLIDYTAEDIRALADVWHPVRNVGASVDSGSFRTRGMLMAPCSIRTLGEITSGVTSSLLTRAADVVLKERRRLVLMVRETPLHLGHLRNMATVTEMGAIVAPPVPAFYAKPNSLDAMITQTAARALDLFDITLSETHRWTES